MRKFFDQVVVMLAFIYNKCTYVFRFADVLARSISEEFSTSDANKYRDEEMPHTSNTKAKEMEERDEEMIKVYDGNNSFRRRIFRVVSFVKEKLKV